jgi:uncharacterized protein YegP (UPF0339 family)
LLGLLGLLGLRHRYQLYEFGTGNCVVRSADRSGEEIIAASQGYETKANAEKGIEAIKTHAPGAKVEDHTG